ncbi:hypothetical protein J6590_052433 [Homalodisca vitripennis]|nr:hypothetical protein J6590_052433 [Homalodisca vitripennis]
MNLPCHPPDFWYLDLNLRHFSIVPGLRLQLHTEGGFTVVINSWIVVRDGAIFILSRGCLADWESIAITQQELFSVPTFSQQKR